MLLSEFAEVERFHHGGCVLLPVSLRLDAKAPRDGILLRLSVELNDLRTVPSLDREASVSALSVRPCLSAAKIPLPPGAELEWAWRTETAGSLDGPAMQKLSWIAAREAPRTSSDARGPDVTA